MGRTFPTDREEKRQVLLAAVERVRDTLRAGADEAEANATLPPATVQALDDAGLLALKLPAVLGGAEADLVTQLEVLEAVTYIDTSAGWCTLIGAAAIAALGAFLADEAPTWAGTPARRPLLRCAPPDVLLRDRPPFLEVRVVLEARDRTERPL